MLAGVGAVPTPTPPQGPAPLGEPDPLPGGGGTYAFSLHQDDGVEPVRWDPCRPVHLVVNARTQPPGAHDLLSEAVAELERTTGLRLVVEGPTTEVPAGEERRSYQPERYGDRWAPVLVAWSDPGEHGALAGAVTGRGGSAAYRTDGGPLVYVSGELVLDGPQLQELGQQPGGYRQARAVLLHELAHVLGLGHVDDPSHLMHPETTTATAFHTGDLAGLVLVGRGRCVPAL